MAAVLSGRSNRRGDLVSNADPLHRVVQVVLVPFQIVPTYPLPAYTHLPGRIRPCHSSSEPNKASLSNANSFGARVQTAHSCRRTTVEHEPVPQCACPQPPRRQRQTLRADVPRPHPSHVRHPVVM